MIDENLQKPPSDHPDEKKTINFGSKPKEPAISPELIELKESVKTIMDSIRNLEDRMTSLDKKTNVIENNLLLIKNKLSTETKSLHSKTLENEKQIDLIKKSIVEVASDMKNFARIEEVETIKKYIDFLQPLNFATKNEVLEIIKENTK